MSKSLNIAKTIKWKKRRETHLMDKCKRANCGICHPEKKWKKTKIKYKNHGE